jgi:hypothetical protein
MASDVSIRGRTRLRHLAGRPSSDGGVLGSLPDSRAGRPRHPLCGKPVRRKEQGGNAVLEDPACGRRKGHNGDCMSEAAWKRKQAADRDYKRGRGRELRAARRHRAAAQRAEEAGWAAARALPPDPDAAGHVAVLLRELDAYQAAHRGEWRAGRACGPWAGGRRRVTSRPREEPWPSEARVAMLRRKHAKAVGLRSRGRRVPVALAELDREYHRYRDRVRKSEAARAA